MRWPRGLIHSTKLENSRKQKMPRRFEWARQLLRIWVIVALAFGLSQTTRPQESRTLTPLQIEIEKQRQRLGSTDVEERRDALMQLGLMRRPEASRVALVALSDAIPMVRATAASAVVSLPADEAAAALIPLLADKIEFVRQQVAYSLGATKSRTAVTTLV